MNQQNGNVNPAIQLLQDQISTENTNYFQAVRINKSLLEARKSRQRINKLQRELDRCFSNEQCAA